MTRGVLYIARTLAPRIRTSCGDFIAMRTVHILAVFAGEGRVANLLAIVGYIGPSRRVNTAM